ncbi:hypothetical protein [Demequina muriae]|uniref:Secreted protein n=1 Tax=Demequina muriae TaxID=3051664 RepID=A0ABT8GIB7_9MICO|nr:hypothetical protein [Demequina sp. EGI L300058]MDN4480691.1 hypothetical protein [Demequina sp. EGI L300058]
MKKAILTGILAGASILVAVTGSPVAAAPSAGGTDDSSQFAGTVSDIVDPAAETGIPRRWMRHVGDPAPSGYSHGYQWGAPSLTTPADAGVVTLEGTLDLIDAAAGDFGLIGLVDTATLAAGERGLNEGAYIYLTMSTANRAIVGLSDGRGAGGEYVQTFHTIDLTGTDRVLDVTFEIDADADPTTCATAAADVATAEGCLTLQIDDLTLLTDSYGSITNDAANGGQEFIAGGTLGWDGLASATAATGIDYDFTVSPTVVLEPQSKADCKKGGWEAFGFRNQGQCVSSVAKNQ